MKLFRVTLNDLLGREWIERIDAYSERDVKDIVYQRYGFRAAVARIG